MTLYLTQNRPPPHTHTPVTILGFTLYATQLNQSSKTIQSTANPERLPANSPNDQGSAPFTKKADGSTCVTEIKLIKPTFLFHCGPAPRPDPLTLIDMGYLWVSVDMGGGGIFAPPSLKSATIARKS